MHADSLSQKHSANCFLNSLFREWTAFSYEEELSTFVIKLKNNDQLVIPIKYYSLVGRHSYGDGFYTKNAKSGETVNISFQELKKIIIDQLSSYYETKLDQQNVFSKRVDDSVNNIKVILDLRKDDIKDLYKASTISFKDAEQGLIIGHTFHPHPKSRDEFNNLDFKLYSPETGGAFNLHWFMVHSDIIHSNISKNFEEKNWSEDIFLKEMNFSKKYNELKDKGYVAYPVHPWQKNILVKMPIIIDYFSNGLIVDMGESFESSEKWHPTSSLRSIYNESSPYMLKFSLSVRLTNSVRHLLPLEVVRGLQVLDVFSTDKGAEFLKQYPQFNILFEPAFMSITDSNKNILNETIVALRLNPFKNNSTQKIVLATLTQDNPIEGLSLIGTQIYRAKDSGHKDLNDVATEWFKKYLIIAVKPLLMAQANLGVLLGAHQQNLIIEIKNNMPFACFFRDCQGTGYSKTGFDIFSKDVDLMTMENGNVLEDVMANNLFSYYLIINSTFNVISTIAKDTGLSEEQFMKVLKSHLIQWQDAGVKDQSCFKYLLESPVLLQKGNFLCSFINMNENTIENPLGIYNSFPNPLFESVL